MIQFNLLPDIKLEYIKAKRSKRMIMLIAMAVAGGALAVFVLLFLTVNVFQKQHLENLSKDITEHSSELESIDDLGRILTVQNQLNKLPELHDNKPVLSRLRGYITQTTPPQVSYATIDVDLATSTISYTGTADTIRTINQFVDTLKFTTYKTADSNEEVSAFTNVVLTSFAKDERGSSYTIDMKFDPLIFSSKSTVTLTVPNIITTRSAIDKPTEDLLQPLSNPAGEDL